MLLRLPAQPRARIAWAKKPIADGLARLRTEPLTDELVAQVAEQSIAPMQAVGVAAFHALAADLDAYRAAMMTDFANDERTLADFVQDEDARDSVAWVTGLLRSFYGTILAMISPQELAGLGEGALQNLASLPELAPMMRGLAALMAATEEARVGHDRNRAGELVDVAFLELTEFRNALHRRGLHLSAFPSATTEERRALLVQAAQRVREALTSEDWASLQAARLTNLR